MDQHTWLCKAKCPIQHPSTPRSPKCSFQKMFFSLTIDAD